MLITISIFSLLVGITFSIIANINIEFEQFRKIQNQKNEVFFAKGILSSDLLKSNNVSFNEDFMKFESLKNGNVIYRVDTETGGLVRIKNGNHLLLEGLNNVSIAKLPNETDKLNPNVIIVLSFETAQNKFRYYLNSETGISNAINKIYNDRPE